MKKIGIAGGIGSGKSVVGRILEAMNFPVYYSDERAKELVDSHPIIREELIKLIGTEVYLDGKLNRPFLAEKLFADDTIRQKVNAIIHPHVREAFQKWTEEQESTLVFNEAAILFETGAYKLMDATLLVVAPKELKIQRVMNRDKITEQQVLERMSKQMSDEEKIPLADFVLVNDEMQPLLIQIEKVVEQLTIVN